MKYILVLFVGLMIGCTNSFEPTETFKPEMVIQPNLEQDSNGYFHLQVEHSNMQTLHRISLNTNYEKSTRIEWQANSSWFGFHMNAEFEIPVINGVSYTSPDDGSAQTMFAPVVELIGDTVTVVAISETLTDSVNIILE